MNEFKISMKAYIILVYMCKCLADRWEKKVRISLDASELNFPKRKWFILWFVVYRTTTVKLLLYILKFYFNIQHPTYTNIASIYKAYLNIVITDDNSNTCCCCRSSCWFVIFFLFIFHFCMDKFHTRITALPKTRRAHALFFFRR